MLIPFLKESGCGCGCGEVQISCIAYISLVKSDLTFRDSNIHCDCDACLSIPFFRLIFIDQF